ncbi:hypothetical protein DY245_03415 [Streptomyces inhibens]|uniref:Uncharacterized protein n=1 Tax=Streptomyces inhibens TaxID=2293571 RepID=A0A371QB02_STRIH|nr:hypothetical protein [Streptomyces inhibens]REK91663.1 hypothetical protein DY245_03415 [Streptomyces inhibens]
MPQSVKELTPQDGHDLAERLVRPVGNVQMRAAVRLLGRHRNGFWLHLFCEQSAENESVGLGSLLEYPDGHPTVDWNAVGLRLLAGPWNVGSPSELAVLRVAASLVGHCDVSLRQVLHQVDATDLPLITHALHEAAAAA